MARHWLARDSVFQWSWLIFELERGRGLESSTQSDDDEINRNMEARKLIEFKRCLREDRDLGLPAL
jgi:hypothetical protein